MREHKHKDQVSLPSLLLIIIINFAFIIVTYCWFVCYFLLSFLYFDKGPFYSQTLWCSVSLVTLHRLAVMVVYL